MSRHRRGLIWITGALIVAYLLWIPPLWNLKRLNPVSTQLMVSRSGTMVTPRVLNPSEWVIYRKIPPSLIRAIVISEDGRFFAHGGIDFFEIKRAVRDALRRKKLPRGASTITQQLMKNLYLSEGFNPLRKVKEAFLGVLVERILSKQRILELYINTIEWGPNVYGVSEAARFYFKKTVSSLSPSESVLLAAIIPNPITVYNPAKNPRQVEQRKQMLLRRISRLPNAVVGIE